MYPKTLYPKTKQVLNKFQELEFIQDWYLAGGTGLALQLGHRKSIDLDFFSEKFPKREILLANISHFKPKIIQEAPGTLDTSIFGTKVSFLEYKYPLLENFVDYEKIKIANVLDIACMKVTAISSRGSKKDLVDLYFILQKHSISDLFTAIEKKYEGVDYQKLHLLKSILYFSDANNDPDPDMIDAISWNDIKDSIESKVKEYLKDSEL